MEIPEAGAERGAHRHPDVQPARTTQCAQLRDGRGNRVLSPRASRVPGPSGPDSDGGGHGVRRRSGPQGARGARTGTHPASTRDGIAGRGADGDASRPGHRHDQRAGIRGRFRDRAGVRYQGRIRSCRVRIDRSAQCRGLPRRRRTGSPAQTGRTRPREPHRADGAALLRRGGVLAGFRRYGGSP